MEVLAILVIGGMMFYFSLKNDKINQKEAIQRLIILEETQQTMNRIESQIVDIQSDIQWRMARQEHMERDFEKIIKRQEDLHFVLAQLLDIPDYDPDNTNSQY